MEYLFTLVRYANYEVIFTLFETNFIYILTFKASKILLFSLESNLN